MVVAKESYIHVGTVTRPHGIKGECCVDWYADSPELLRGKFYLQKPSEGLRSRENLPPLHDLLHTLTPIVKATVRMHKGRPLLTLPHVTDRTQAEALRGARIYVSREALAPLQEDEAYIHDILGMTVVNVTDATNESVVGILEDITFSPAHMIWLIRRKEDDDATASQESASEGREILFPAVEEFIDSFDLDAGIIRIKPPPGLLEIYLS